VSEAHMQLKHTHKPTPGEVSTWCHLFKNLKKMHCHTPLLHGHPCF